MHFCIHYYNPIAGGIQSMLSILHEKNSIFCSKGRTFCEHVSVFPQKKPPHSALCSGLIPAERFRMAPHTLWLFSAEVPLYAPRVKMFLECSILLTDSRNSAPEPAAACARGKRRSRHTGKACCGSPADRGTARWAPVPAAPAPAGKAQSPCRRAEWGT